jgi:two-component system NtrC family sensor kinase
MDSPPDPRGPAAQRVAPRLARGFALLWFAAVMVPVLGMAGAGVASWQAVQSEAEARLDRTVELLRQNALRALGTQEAILAAVSRATQGRPPALLREDAGLHGLLAELAASGAPVINGVLVTDSAARIVAASWEFPARDVDLSDRDYVQALRDPARQRAVGEPVTSRPMGWPIIPIARRAAPAPEGGAQGLLVSSFSPEAFGAFYASVAEGPADVVALVRSDGMLLARHPPVDLVQAGALRDGVAALLAPLLRQAGTAAWLSSPFDGVERLFVARSVGDWPMAVAYGLDPAVLRSAWRQRMVAPGAGGLAAMALLLALTATAQRSAQRQREQAESRAEAEAQLARAGRAAAIGLLAAGLAHDVKNLVQSVRSGARIMQRRAAEPEEVKRCAELLADAAERGGKLVDAMLAFARGGSAPDAPAPPLEVGRALADLADLLGRTLGSAWRVRALLPPGLPPARGDRAGFEAAVVNLAANARDAMPGGGTVTIAAWMEDLEESLDEIGLRPGRYVVAAVRDTGIGMDPETLARVGEPFFTTKGTGLGTGLGLATVRGFCARAGGALRMESAPGRGTTAAIWLPVA